jgi:hypothetical protein
MPFNGVLPAEKLTPAPYGLLSVADVTEHGSRDEHWIGGFSAESEACAFNATLIDICGDVNPVTVRDTLDAQRWINVEPYGIVARDHCLTPGLSVIDRRARVLRQLDLITPKSVETELWQGLFRRTADGAETGMYLASTAATTITGTAQKVRVGLGLLEQNLANCSSGFQGVIHITPLVAALLGTELDLDKDTLFTKSGNKVAIGVGYDGRGPGDDTSPAASSVQHWMYATGPVFVHLGTDELVTVNDAQSVDPRTNIATWVAEKPAISYWDGCCHFAVKVDVTL